MRTLSFPFCKTIACFLFVVANDLCAGTGLVKAANDGARVVLKQPILCRVLGNFHVPLAEHGYPHDQPFNLILWQPNPSRPDGQLVPSGWQVGDLTGFYPTTPLEQHQAAFDNQFGVSTVQIEGSIVGAYINSADLTNGSGGNKMMITPAYMIPESERVKPFQNSDNALVNSLQLQVPTARDENKEGNFTYVVADFVFRDLKTQTEISYGVSLFHHDPRSVDRNLLPRRDVLAKTETGGYDGPSHSYQVGNMLAPGSRIVTPLFQSTLFQVQPWRGWRRFEFAITYNNFKNALDALKTREAKFNGSDDPSNYTFLEWHLNAELKYSSGPAELGWSLRDTEVNITSISDLRVWK